MYDPLDPYGLLRPRVQPLQTQRPVIDPYTPAEESSVLKTIAGGALGGLGYVGSVLEKTLGGRAIRGALGGKPRELLSILPGSDTFGITDEADRVSGRDLLRNASLIGHEDTWGNFAGGLGLEMALDPAMYLSFGSRALTKGGEALRRAGALPATTAERVGTTLGEATTAKGFGDLGRVSAQNERLATALTARGEQIAPLLNEPLGYSVGFGLPFMRPFTGLGQSGLTMARLLGTGGLTRGGEALRRVGGDLPQTTAGLRGTTLREATTTLPSAAVGPVGPLPPGPQVARVTALNERLAADLAARGEDIAPLLDRPLGYPGALSLVDAGMRKVPLTGHLYGGGSDLAQKAAGKVGLYGRAALQKDYLGATTHAEQADALAASRGAAKSLVEDRKQLGRWYYELKGARDEAGNLVDPTGELTRHAAETWHLMSDAEKAALHPTVRKVAGEFRVWDDAKDLARREIGGPGGTQADPERLHMYRQLTPPDSPMSGGGKPRQPASPIDPRLSGGEEIYIGIKGATRGLEKLLIDPEVLGGNPVEAATRVRREYLRSFGGKVDDVSGTTAGERKLFELRNKPDLTAAEVAERDTLLAQWKQAERLVDRARTRDPAYAANPGVTREFGRHFLEDQDVYAERFNRMMANTQQAQTTLARAAIPSAAVGPVGPLPPGFRGLADLPPGSVRLAEALEKVGMGEGAQGAMVKRLNELRGPLAAGEAPLDINALRSLHVPESAIGSVNRYLKEFTTPQYVSTPGRALDVVTNWTKAISTAPWLSHHVRNRFTGLTNNVFLGGANQAEGGIMRQSANARSLFAGDVVEGAGKIPEYAARGLSDADATREIAAAMYAHLGPQGAAEASDVIGAGGQTIRAGTGLEGFGARIPGEVPATYTKAARQYLAQEPGQKASNFLKPHLTQGVGSNIDVFPPMLGGRTAGRVVEGTNRGELWLALKRQGWSDEAVAKEVNRIHFPYGPEHKTALERDVLSRLIPFYTYSRYNLPLVAGELATRPGGFAGTAARLAQSVRGEGFIPDYLGSGLATPIGAEQDGTQRYLTKLDLAPEQAFEWLKGGPKGAQGSAMAVLGQTNPLLKGPLEWITGKQFYSGRNVDDLYSLSGSSNLDQLISMSPFARAWTTLRTLADTRKYQSPASAAAIATNLATGARISDVDVNKQRSIAEREYLQAEAAGQPDLSKFETLYLRPGLEHLLTPKEHELLRLQKTLQERALAEAKKKKAGGH